MKKANIDPCENGYIVNMYTEGGGNKTFVAKSEEEAVVILKREFKKGEKK